MGAADVGLPDDRGAGVGPAGVLPLTSGGGGAGVAGAMVGFAGAVVGFAGFGVVAPIVVIIVP